MRPACNRVLPKRGSYCNVLQAVGFGAAPKVAAKIRAPLLSDIDVRQDDCISTFIRSMAYGNPLIVHCQQFIDENQKAHIARNRMHNFFASPLLHKG